MVWSLALCPGDTKQDSVVYGAEFGVVFLAKGPRTASIQEGLDCLRLNHSGLEGERDFRLVVEPIHRHVKCHKVCIFMTKDPPPRRVFSLKHKNMGERWSHSLY